MAGAVAAAGFPVAAAEAVDLEAVGAAAEDAAADGVPIFD
jgi:hypothetical protein